MEDVTLNLLTRLAEAGGQVLTVDALMRALRIPRAAIHRSVDELRMLGYVVEPGHTHGSAGLRLIEGPDRLLAHEIERHLRTKWAGVRLEVHPVLGSTNDRAKDLARDSAPSGTLVVAEEQTAGRGRQGRRWHSPAGTGLYLSLVYRPEPAPPSAALLQVTAGVALAHAAMRLTGKPASLRWPNDVLFEGKKVAGILAEALSPDTYVVGIGLNVNQAPEDFPEDLREEATSLKLVRGHPLDRRRVIGTLLTSLEDWYDRVAGGETEAVADAWRPLSSLLDREVVLRRGDHERRGRVTDLCPLRGVHLTDADGADAWHPAAHVSFIRPV